MSVAVAKAKSDQAGVYEREDLLNGCQAVAQGVRLADVDVIAAYPISPQTHIVEGLVGRHLPDQVDLLVGATATMKAVAGVTVARAHVVRVHRFDLR